MRSSKICSERGCAAGVVVSEDDGKEEEDGEASSSGEKLREGGAGKGSVMRR
jgi:hypothetical protein